MPRSVSGVAAVRRARRIPVRASALIVTVAAAAASLLGMLPAPPQSPGPLAHPAVQMVYRLPVDDVVVRRFERPARRWSPGHRGIDIEAPAVTPVLAPGDGVVTFSGTVVDRGVLTIRHPDGLRSSLEPIVGGVPLWTQVRGGDVVGAVADGGTHCAPEDCLHWGVRRGDDYLDPLDLLPGAAPTVLLAQGLSSGRSPEGSHAAGAWPPCASGRCVTR